MVNIADTNRASYPACDHGLRHALIIDRGVAGRYWRRCQVCSKMAVAPVKSRVFSRRHKGEKPSSEVPIPAVASARRYPLMFACRGYELEYRRKGHLLVKIKGHVVAEFSDFSEVLVWLKRRGLPYPFC